MLVTYYIEILPTDTVKYEFDKLTGHLKIDRLSGPGRGCLPALADRARRPRIGGFLARPRPLGARARLMALAARRSATAPRTLQDHTPAQALAGAGVAIAGTGVCVDTDT